MCYYIYKFLNGTSEIIYIGQTTNIKNRIERQHFTRHGHLPKECYGEVSTIYYAKLNSKTDMDLYERYLISKHTPKFNIIHNNGGVTLQLNDPNWTRYEKESSKRIYLVNLLKSSKQCENPQYTTILKIKNSLDILRGSLLKYCVADHYGDFCDVTVANKSLDDECDYDCDTCDNCVWVAK